MDLLKETWPPQKKKKEGEESPDSGPKKVKTPIPDDPFAKDDVEEGGPGSGPHGDEDNPFDKEPTDDEMADIEKEFEGVVKEGPSYEYANYMKKIEKAENNQAKEVNKFVQLLMKKGLKKEATAVSSKYVRGVAEFDNFLKKIYGKIV